MFQTTGSSRLAFCGLITLLFALCTGLAFLKSNQENSIYDSGLTNQHSYGWIEKSYYSWSVLGSLGAIIVGQTRRVYHIEHDPELPPLRARDALSGIISLFFGGFFMAWGLEGYSQDQFGWPQRLSKWCFAPFVFFFAFIAVGSHMYLKVKQDTRQWAGIAVITASLIILLIVYEQPKPYVFPVQAFTLFTASVFCYTHFCLKLEFMLKRRACTVFEVAEKFGAVLLATYTFCILCTSIYQYATGNEWIFGIYIQAVFTNSSANLFLTILVPFVCGMCQVVSLVLIQNSSVMRLLTIVFMPLSFAFMFSISKAFRTSAVITSIILFFTGLVMYNAASIFGSQTIQEEKIGKAFSFNEDEDFKRARVISEDVENSPKSVV